MRAFVAFMVLGAAAVAVTVWGGWVDVSASGAGGLSERVLGYASLRSIRHHAPKTQNPLGSAPDVVEKGLRHYREHCAPCHGGPNEKSADFAAGLNPPPPDLSAPELQRAFSDGMLFWTIASGIRATGMPAFAAAHTNDEIWQIVAAVRSFGRAPRARARAPAEAEGQAIQIEKFQFVPAKLEIKAGERVTWHNGDFVPHTVTADDKSFDSSKIPSGGDWQWTATGAGTHTYFCRYHAKMRGTIVVRR